MLPFPPQVLSAPGAAKDVNLSPPELLPLRLLPKVFVAKGDLFDAIPTEPKGDGAMTPNPDNVGVDVPGPSTPLIGKEIILSPEDLSWGKVLAAADPKIGALPVEDAANDPNGEADDFDSATKPDEAKAAEDVRDFDSEASSVEVDKAPSEDFGVAWVVKGDVAEVSAKTLLLLF